MICSELYYTLSRKWISVKVCKFWTNFWSRDSPEFNIATDYDFTLHGIENKSEIYRLLIMNE